ncbi:MAG: DUF5320 domain-containing protein [Mesotoga sp.]|uniref:DUF5320 domain-containing protein n=2 Tax=Mesotoga infera TaxID=1236046 RepID=A0A7Z7PPU3_9BACT|nr:DUF5320 domain-containing protein [Mesotoga sp.]SSC11730.1 conserved protein of unknown function [Mesotoga infera]HON28026.1 DUF5320 domain-containing protein [Mesotoga infera]HRR43860.1 DUF5320 domain-containing protein [Mesotoga sp.]
MPWRDGTGPSGQGPMTGRGMGNCAPKDSVSGLDVTRIYGGRMFFGGGFYLRGFRLGLGLSTGHRRGFRLGRRG